MSLSIQPETPFVKAVSGQCISAKSPAGRWCPVSPSVFTKVSPDDGKYAKPGAAFGVDGGKHISDRIAVRNRIYNIR